MCLTPASSTQNASAATGHIHSHLLTLMAGGWYCNNCGGFNEVSQATQASKTTHASTCVQCGVARGVSVTAEEHAASRAAARQRVHAAAAAGTTTTSGEAMHVAVAASSQEPEPLDRAATPPPGAGAKLIRRTMTQQRFRSVPGSDDGDMAAQHTETAPQPLPLDLDAQAHREVGAGVQPMAPGTGNAASPMQPPPGVRPRASVSTLASASTMTTGSSYDASSRTGSTVTTTTSGGSSSSDDSSDGSSGESDSDGDSDSDAADSGDDDVPLALPVKHRRDSEASSTVEMEGNPPSHRHDSGSGGGAEATATSQQAPAADRNAATADVSDAAVGSQHTTATSNSHQHAVEDEVLVDDPVWTGGDFALGSASVDDTVTAQVETAAGHAEPDVRSTLDDSDSKTAPAGRLWTCAVDPNTGYAYYYDDVDGASVWVLPNPAVAVHDQWECNNCTLHNGLAQPACTACSTLRPFVDGYDVNRAGDTADAAAAAADTTTPGAAAAEAAPVIDEASAPHGGSSVAEPASNGGGSAAAVVDSGAPTAVTLDATQEGASGAARDEDSWPDWTCVSCTFINPGRAGFCMMCGTQYGTPAQGGASASANSHGDDGESDEDDEDDEDEPIAPARVSARAKQASSAVHSKHSTRHVKGGAKERWACPMCTLRNPPGSALCAACGSLPPKGVASPQANWRDGRGMAGSAIAEFDPSVYAANMEFRR